MSHFVPLRKRTLEFKKLEAIDDGLLADAGQPRNAVERRAHLAIVEGEVQKAFEDARHGARDALLALLAAMPVGAALDHVEGIQNARIGIAVDPQLWGGLKQALGAVVGEVRPFLKRLVVKAFDKGALVLRAGLSHEIG